MRKDIAEPRNRSLEQEEQRQGVQPIGSVLNELFAQYCTRFPHLNVMVVFPQRPSEAGRR
jgi:hypothetical protein